MDQSDIQIRNIAERIKKIENVMTKHDDMIKKLTVLINQLKKVNKYEH